jgi:predicted alpha/beta superfamily hydrolase
VIAPLGDCEVHDLASHAVGDTFRIFVGHCHDGRVNDVPAVYVSDANGSFGLTVDIVRHLQLGGHVPPLVVVGIGYPVALLRQTLAPRTRDLTPTVSPVMTDGAGDVMASGGAAAFRAFVADELQPWVRERLPVGPDAVYVGHSLGGLFGACTLFERPATFRGYALASPSIWWDDHVVLRHEAAYAASHADLAATVVVTVGGHETAEGRVRAAEQVPAFARATLTAPVRDMVADATTFAGALAGRGYPSLDVRYRVLADEHHVSIPAVATSHALRVLFGAPGADDLVPRLV